MVQTGPAPLGRWLRTSPRVGAAPHSLAETRTAAGQKNKVCNSLYLCLTTFIMIVGLVLLIQQGVLVGLKGLTCRLRANQFMKVCSIAARTLVKPFAVSALKLAIGDGHVAVQCMCCGKCIWLQVRQTGVQPVNDQHDTCHASAMQCTFVGQMSKVSNQKWITKLPSSALVSSFKQI